MIEYGQGATGEYFVTHTGGLGWRRNKTQDGHGGHAREHREEMRKIAEDTINELVPKMCEEIFNNAVSNLIGAIEYDVETCVSVSLDSAGKIFDSSELKKVLSKRIMDELLS